MTSPTTGHPIWIDLLSTDLEAAKHFYGELLGWTFEDRGEAFGNYHIIQKDGQDVGGAMQRVAGMHDGSPDNFSVYLSTDDAHATAERAVAAGGRIAVPPMQVGDQGTMLGVIDAAGSYVGAWQPAARTGITATGAGAPVWFELMTTYFDLAVPFYQHVFGFEAAPLGEGRYVTNGTGEAASSGICDAAAWFAAGTSFWRAYLAVDDLDAAVATVQRLGGALVDGPVDSPYGRVATVVDNQGVMFQLLQPPVEAGADDAAATVPAAADDAVADDAVADDAVAEVAAGSAEQELAAAEPVADEVTAEPEAEATAESNDEQPSTTTEPTSAEVAADAGIGAEDEARDDEADADAEPADEQHDEPGTADQDDAQPDEH